MTPRRWRVGVHLGLSRASDVTRVCQYKGDSKSEQMAFIVDHSPCRDAVRPYTIVPYGISRKTRRRYRLPTTPSNKPPEGERERERERGREGKAPNRVREPRPNQRPTLRFTASLHNLSRITIRGRSRGSRAINNRNNRALRDPFGIDRSNRARASARPRLVHNPRKESGKGTRRGRS
jgi:hypothetical protein